MTSLGTNLYTSAFSGYGKDSREEGELARTQSTSGYTQTQVSYIGCVHRD